MIFFLGSLMNNDIKQKIDAATFRRLIDFLQKNTELQNIDLMNLAGFCRNCLSKWMVEEGKKVNIDISYDDARKSVYGMDYEEWKKKFQKKID